MPDPFYPEIGLKEFEEQYVIPRLKREASQKREWIDVEEISMAFQILDPGGVGFPELYNYRLTAQMHPGTTLESPNAGFPQQGLLYQLSYDTQQQIKEDIGDVVFCVPAPRTWGEDYYAGFHHFWSSGRSPFRVPGYAEYLGVEEVDGVECHILTFKLESGKLQYIWIDPEKGFCVRRSERRKNPESVQPEVRRSSKNFQQFGDLWYPTFVEYRLYDEKGELQSIYDFQILSAAFNVTFPDAFFHIDNDFFFKQN